MNDYTAARRYMLLGWWTIAAAIFAVAASLIAYFGGWIAVGIFIVHSFNATILASLIEATKTIQPKEDSLPPAMNPLEFCQKVLQGFHTEKFVGFLYIARLTSTGKVDKTQEASLTSGCYDTPEAHLGMSAREVHKRVHDRLIEMQSEPKFDRECEHKTGKLN